MATTPTWSAARSGLLGDTGAVDASAQINQFLGTHPMTVVYQGNQVLTPQGSGNSGWSYYLGSYDIDQPFTMSGTTIGRVSVPVLPVGTGADLLVGLYSNNAGVPGTLITQTRIPASWINAVAAVSAAAGPSSSPLLLRATGNPLATAQFNELAIGSALTSVSFSLAAGDASGAELASATVAGDFMLFIGGQTNAGVFTSVVTSAQWTGGSSMSQAVLQPALPQPTGFAAVAATSDTIVVTGGATNASTLAPLNNVWCASWDATTGVIGAWSAQAALPETVKSHAMACWNETVYVIGGNTTAPSPTFTNAVYYATVSNGQIGAWNAGPPYPKALQNVIAGVVGNFLVVAGGNLTGNPFANVFYAPINPDGSLGNWVSGPALPTGVDANPAGTSMALTSAGLIDVGGFVASLPAPMQTLAFGAQGPGTWRVINPSTTLITSGNNFAAAFPNGAGAWEFFATDSPVSTLYNATVNQVPRVSVPLPASGLTNGATYHVVISQPNGDLNNYLVLFDDMGAFPGAPTAQTRARGSTSWVAGTSGREVPIQIFDQTAGGQPLHLWSDSGAWINTFVYATTPDQRPIGLMDAVAQPAPVLNQSPTFTRGLGPWNVFGGSATTSNAFTHGSLPLSAKITPTGSASLSYIESDKVAATPGHSYLVSGWFYSPTGYNNIGVSVNWFTASKSYISSTTASNITIPANTWTLIQGTVTNNVANAVFVDVVCIEGGTPPATAIFYVSAATIQDASGPQVSSVALLDWSTWWPAQLGLPLGVTVLA